MKNNYFYDIDNTEKLAIFTEVATQKGMNPFAVEKDWWVSRTLEIIFEMPLARYLVFKGGTSLSKAWKLINRFSEDIDLAIDKSFFKLQNDKISRTQISKLRKEAGSYITTIFFKELEQKFQSKGFSKLYFNIIDAKDSDQDPRVLEIYYPNIVNPNTDYLLPKLQIEVSCRSLREPFTVREFGFLIDEFYPDKNFTSPYFKVPTVNPERTFLEKLFLLHEEFHRPKERIRVNRLSRHLYDIYYLKKSKSVSKVIYNKKLYEMIVNHRYQFARVSKVNYNLHDPKKLNPIPPPELINDWIADYAKMKEDMIYDESKPSFQDLITNLEELKSQLRAVAWKFELTFPTPD